MLKINPKFRDLIPPLTAEELAQLESNCLAEGIMHPIIVWDGYIVDGHNRWALVQKHGLDYRTEAKNFESEGDALLWIITHQLGRRNLNAYNRGVLALQMEGVFREKAKVNQVRTTENRVSLISEKQDTYKEVAKIANLGHDTIAKVKAIEARATPEVKAQLAKGDLTINKAYQDIKSVEKKEERKADIQKQVAQIEAGELPTLKGKYHVVSIDPPWDYAERGGFSSDQHDPESNRGGVDYPVMSIAQIKAIGLPLADDAVVFLWTTHKFLRDAFDIADAWGLEYKATMVWDKVSMGMGRNIRLQCEFCLMLYKGKPFVEGSAERDIIREQRREHSRKPDAFFDMVDRMCHGRKLEYFSREQRKNWDIYGNDTEKF